MAFWRSFRERDFVGVSGPFTSIPVLSCDEIKSEIQENNIIAFITRSMSGCPGLAEQKALLRPIELESILEWQAPYEFSHLLQHLGLVGKEDEMIRLQADDACIGQRRFEYGRIVSF